MYGRRHVLGSPPRAGLIDVSEARAVVQRLHARHDALLSKHEGALSEVERLKQALAAAERRCDASEQAHRESSDARDRALAERDEAQEQLGAELDRSQAREEAPRSEELEHLAADLANVRRNSRLEIEGGVRREKSRLLVQVLAFGDSIDAALRNSPDPSSPWHAGLVALRDQLTALFSREGATRTGSVGEAFDPAIHEALAIVPGGSPDQVIEVISSGLVFEDGVLVRPAQVVVSG